MVLTQKGIRRSAETSDNTRWGGLGNPLVRIGQPGGGRSLGTTWVLRVGLQGSQQNTWDRVPPSPLAL